MILFEASDKKQGQTYSFSENRKSFEGRKKQAIYLHKETCGKRPLVVQVTCNNL